MSGLKQSQMGFSLVELSIVLVVVGILLSGFVAGATRFIQQARESKAKADIETIKEALLGYAIVNGRLPCPDTNGFPDKPAKANGGEDKNDCDEMGFIPSVDLGIQVKDPWGMLYYYRVDEKFANESKLKLATEAKELKVQEKSSGGDTIADPVAVVFSLGANQHNTEAMASDDEDENLDGDKKFVSKPPDKEFDDIVAWLSPNILKARMVQARKLPVKEKSKN